MSENKALLLDPARLRTLRELGIMDASPEPAFDRLTRLAARLLGAPVALVSLVDDERQFFMSSVGLPEPWASSRGTPLSHSFCQHVVNEARPLIIDDATQNALVKTNLAIRDLGVIAYAGMPITSDLGQVLGSFCVIDVKPRRWSPDEINLLLELAELCSSELALREQVQRREEVTRRLERILAQSPAPVLSCDRYARIISWNAAAESTFGYSAREVHGQTPQALLFSPQDQLVAEERLGDLVIEGATSQLPPCRRSDGTAVPCRWSATPVFAPNGEFDGFIALLSPCPEEEKLGEIKRDLTALETIARRLGETSDPAAQRASSELRRLLRSLGDSTIGPAT